MNTEDVQPARKKLGEIIRAERERQGLIPFEVAKASEASITQLKSIEEGTKDYTVNTLLRVLGALQCSVIIINEDLIPTDVIEIV